jgi:multimeric flavodoxin WrbA
MVIAFERTFLMKKNYKPLVLGLVGSPNKTGGTNELVSATLAGASSVGSATELVQLSDHVVGSCRDCLPWVCATNLKCTYKDDNFELLSQKILSCRALVIGTPIYLGDTSAMLRYLFIKMARVFAQSGQLRGVPSLGIAMAGGDGKGLVTGLRPVYHFFRTMQMQALEPLPATRFNLDKAKKAAEILGRRLSQMMTESVPFNSPEECELWYDRMYFLGENRADERRLMAAMAYDAIPVERKKDVNGRLVQVSILSAVGRSRDALDEVNKVYNSCIGIIDQK